MHRIKCYTILTISGPPKKPARNYSKVFFKQNTMYLFSLGWGLLCWNNLHECHVLSVL